MLHIVKLCVGCDSIEDLGAWQAQKGRRDPPLRHQTRNFPRRAAEIVAGGSLYWVMAGSITARQRITDIIRDAWDDGSPCAGLVLDPALVPVRPRAMRPFQGWRYLEAADAPPDLAGREAETAPGMPPAMRRELAALGLL
jgi:hypothetical protein